MNKKKEQVIVLKEKEGARLLPIVIGIGEATAIKNETWVVFIPQRPLTHDLILAIIGNLKLIWRK